MPRRTATLFAAAGAVLLSSALSAQTLGAERTLQRFPDGYHGWARAAADADGGGVVIWNAVEDLRTGPGQVFLELLAPGGTPQGEPFRAGTGTRDENGPDVAMAEDGSFVAVWEEVARHYRSVLARRFDAQGRPLGDPFLVASLTRSVPFQLEPAIGIAADGGFVIAWAGGTQSTNGSTSDVYVRRFDAAGRPLGPETQVNVTKWGAQYEPRIAMRPSGGFLIGWTTNAGRRTLYDVYARSFKADGTPLGGEIRLNSGPSLPAFQLNLALAVASDGSFVAVWQDDWADRAAPSFAPEDRVGLLGQRFAADGRPVGPLFRVNATAKGEQRQPAVAITPDGFLVAWESTTPVREGYEPSIRVRRFSRAAAPLTGEITVDPGGSSYSEENPPALALGPGGSGFVAWSRLDADGFGSAVLVREIQP